MGYSIEKGFAGSDGFVYNDNFNFTVDDLINRLSVSEEQAHRILDLTRRGSASHSAWLMFMYPRLVLARDLLSVNGIMMISIDENEQANLELVCNDIFGEENHLVTMTRRTKNGGGILWQRIMIRDLFTASLPDCR